MEKVDQQSEVLKFYSVPDVKKLEYQEYLFK